jgi:hypothetical protein
MNFVEEYYKQVTKKTKPKKSNYYQKYKHKYTKPNNYYYTQQYKAPKADYRETEIKHFFSENVVIIKSIFINVDESLFLQTVEESIKDFKVQKDMLFFVLDIVNKLTLEDHLLDININSDNDYNSLLAFPLNNLKISNQRFFIEHLNIQGRRTIVKNSSGFYNYYPKLCNNDNHNEEDFSCKYSHNLNEKNYHPLFYKSTKCKEINCQLIKDNLPCPSYHSIDDFHFIQNLGDKNIRQLLNLLISLTTKIIKFEYTKISHSNSLCQNACNEFFCDCNLILNLTNFRKVKLCTSEMIYKLPYCKNIMNCNNYHKK